MRGRSGTTLVLTSFELAMMIHIVAKLDPKDYKHNEAKALIHKCKAQIDNPSDYVQVV